ncbi:RDD family protein [Flavobacterium sp.]|uniref:RDD family protein n=1 Tax=Flavobacterium sp. TaxID=239 RepID=UPI0025C17367|nr:RDD family protein [Flavobacterium sp.]
MAKKIALISFVAALLGLMAQFFEWFKFSQLGGFLHIVNVSYLGQNLEDGATNYLAVAFFLLFALSAILYWTSQFRETRLLRLCLSFIFFSKIISFPFSIGWTSWLVATYEEVKFDYVSILYWIWIVFLGWLCFKALQFLNSQKELATEETLYGETTVVQQLAASNWTRFFHSLFDGIILYIVISPFANAIVTTFVKDLSRSEIGASFQIYGMIFICQVLYYLIFETIFASSPAKFLSESRVVDSEGQKPKFKTILARTFSRFIPFDGASFLFGANWHDQFSSTEVVLEKRTGTSGSTYLWSFFLFALLLPVIYLMKISYDDRQQKEIAQEIVAERTSYLEKRLDKLSPGEVIWLKSTSYASDCFIVAESGTPKEMEFRLVTEDQGGSYMTYEGFNLKKFGEFYEYSKENFETVTLSAEHLKTAISKEIKTEDEMFGFPGTRGNFTMESIDKLYAPKLSCANVTFYSEGKFRGSTAFDADKANFTISNDGSPVKVVKIVSHTDLKWKESSEKNSFPRPDEVIMLEATGDDFDEIDLEFTVRDELGRNHKYRMKSKSVKDMPELRLID